MTTSANHQLELASRLDHLLNLSEAEARLANAALEAAEPRPWLRAVAALSKEVNRQTLSCLEAVHRADQSVEPAPAEPKPAPEPGEAAAADQDEDPPAEPDPPGEPARDPANQTLRLARQRLKAAAAAIEAAGRQRPGWSDPEANPLRQIRARRARLKDRIE